MADIAQEVLLAHLLAILREGVDGPVGEFAYFSDSGPASGLRALLKTVSAEKASQKIAGNSVAAQVHHLTFSLSVTAKWLRGDRTRPDWDSSWDVSEVTSEAWDTLRYKLFNAFEECYMAVESDVFETDMNAGLGLGMAAHLIYHLGAIRQKCMVIG